jgi:hypothetical protein
MYNGMKVIENPRKCEIPQRLKRNVHGLDLEWVSSLLQLHQYKVVSDALDITFEEEHIGGQLV